MDCGTISYSLALASQSPLSPDPFLSHTADSLTKSIVIALDKNLISAGLTSSFDLTATLDSYP